jgi:hypothetical protein
VSANPYDVGRGINAQAVLENPEFRAAVQDVRAAVREAIELTAPADTAMREFLYQSLRTLPMIEQALTRRMNTGAITAVQLAQAENELGI